VRKTRQAITDAQRKRWAKVKRRRKATAPAAAGSKQPLQNKDVDRL
jgi:hypothetical protein